jgi:hypothetical protein
VTGLRVGEARVHLRFWRDGDGRSHHQVVAREGRLRVVRQPPPQALAATPWRRLGALAGSLLR